MYVPMQQRRDVAANWTSGNPVLLSGEIGLETDTSKFKIGDGVTAWTSLSYFSGGGSGSISSVFGRTGTVVATSGDYTVSQVTGAAPSASPTFTGTPAGPTATPGTSTTQLATTAFVIANSAVASVFGRTGAVTAQSGDYSVGQVTGAAGTASPAFSGTPTTPTATALTSNTQIASTAYADAAVTVEKNRAQTAEGLALQKASNLSDLGTRQTAMNNLAGAVTTNQFLRGNGSNVVMAAIVAADLPAATTSTQGATIIDGTATDIVASPGTQAAGAVGKVADAGHVHPQPSFFAPTGITGATTATRYVGGTLTGPPLTGTFSVGDWVQAQDGPEWVCVIAGTPGSWKVVGDAAYQFRPETYGAVGNGRVVTDASMSATTTLTCATSTPFVSTDVGKHVLVSAALGAYSPLHSTISSFTDSGHVVLANTATATTGGTPGAIMYFGTDDTAAIQSAINAASTYAQAHNGFAEVLFGNKIYIIAGTLVQTQAVGGGNWQIGLPIITPGSATQVVLALTGVMKTTPLMHWVQTSPQQCGTVLASVITNGNATGGGSNGPSSIIGGPVNGYGGEPGTYSNCVVKVNGIGTLVPYNSTVCGMDLFGMLEADVENFWCMAAAVVPTSAAPIPTMATPTNITNQYTFGIRMPTTGNQVVCRLTNFSCEGLCYGFCPSEWTVAHDVHCMYNIVCIAPWAGGVSMVHAIIIFNAQCENSTNALGMNGTGTARIDIYDLQTESISSGNTIFDTTNQMQGTIHLRAQGSSGSYTASGWLSGSAGGHFLKIINEMTTPGPIASPQAAVASGSPWFNGYTRDAFMTLSATTITAVSVTGQNNVTTSLAVPSSATTYNMMLPSGASYTWTGTGTMTHTVTTI
jgi:hypothetical protein